MIRDASTADDTNYTATTAASASALPESPSPGATRAGLPSASPTAPYWLQTPSAALLGHRTTASLPGTADVVIVGSGITGAFAADTLAGSGLSVVLLEAREACYGATGRNGGHCQPLVYGGDHDVAAFELATFRFLRDFVAQHAVPCDWRTLPGGGVHAYLDAELYALAAEAVRRLQTQRPGPDDLGGCVRATTDVAPLRLRSGPGRVAGAVVQTHAASVWPYKLVAWVLERLVREQKGAGSFNLQTSTPVLRLEKQPTGWTVVTPRGSVAARAVLLATNGYTSHLLPAWADLIVPIRGQVAALVPPTQSAADRVDRSYVFLGGDGTENDRDEYLVQRPFTDVSSASASASAATSTGHLILGGGRQRAAHRAVGEWRDDVVEPGLARYLRTHLTPLLDLGGGGTGNPELAADYEWTGTMGFSRDQHPWVGEVPPSAVGLAEGTAAATGLYMSAGYTGHGMPSAALCGRAVARMIKKALGASSDADADPTAADAPMPACFRITEDRIRATRAACEPVAEADAKGLLDEFRQLLGLS